MKIRTLTMNRNKTQDYQSRGAKVTLEFGPGDTYRDAVRAGNVLLAVALGEAPGEAEVERARALLERAHVVDVVEAAVTSPPAQCRLLEGCGNFGGQKRHDLRCPLVVGEVAVQPPKPRRGRPPKANRVQAEQPAGK